MDGHFFRLWGEGVDLGQSAMRDANSAQVAAENFWRNNQDLLPAGVSAADMRLTRNTESMGVRYVAYQQLLSGVPVIGTRNWLAISHGRAVIIGVHSLPAKKFDATPSIVSNDAAQRAAKALQERGIANGTAQDPILSALPVVVDGVVDYRLVYEVELKTGAGRWTAYIDAKKGDLFALKDERMWDNAAVHVMYNKDAKIPGQDRVAVPAPYLNLSIDGSSVTSDWNGEFPATGESTSFSASVRGKYFNVVSSGGGGLTAEGTASPGNPYIWDDGEEESAQAQLDAYRSSSIVREHCKSWGAAVDDLNLLDGNMRVNVNVNGSCNAFADGDTINFYGEAGGCNNTASLAGVVYHEYGHNFHFAANVAGVDGGVSEGLGDVLSQSITKLSVVGPYFFVGDPKGIRDPEINKVWPDDRGEVHDEGLIIGGALWDLRKAYVAKYGYVDGHFRADLAFVSSARNMNRTDTGLEAALLADDDNGNLADGTPNSCIIEREYALHGLAESNDMPIEMAHTTVDSAKPDEAITIEATVSVGNDDKCSKIGNVRIFYAIGTPDAWEEVEMDNTSGDDYSAAIPAQPAGTTVYYRVEAVKELSGESVNFPANRAEPYYTIYIGELEEIFCDDFETANSDWTHELLDGESDGDDWQVGAPGGQEGDPEKAFSGSKAWGNDLDDDGLYVAGASSALHSPKWDLSKYGKVHLRFRRWLNVQDGEHDHASISVNDNEVWANAASGAENGWVHHQDKEWMLVDLDITEFAAEQSDVQVSWKLESDGELNLGGWNIDDVCVYGELLPDDTTSESTSDSTSDSASDSASDSNSDSKSDDGSSDATGSGSEGSDDSQSGDNGSSGDDSSDNDPGVNEQSTGCGCDAKGSKSATGFAAFLAGIFGLGLRRRRRRHVA